MKWMFKFVFIAAALWSGYWYFGAQAQEKIYAELLIESRNQGWTAESRNLGVSGFPNRFDTTLTGLNFRDPSGRWSWRGEEFQIKALSYKLNHIIMAWPGEQTVSTPEGNATINAELLRASLVVSPRTNLPLSRFQIEGEAIELDIDQLGKAAIGMLNGAFHQEEDNATKYLLGINLQDITPPQSLTSSLGGGRIFSGNIEGLVFSAEIEFDREIDRLALQSGQPPRPINMEIKPSLLIWGDSELAVSGDLSKGDNGFVEGRLEFDVKNWQPMYQLFDQASHLTTTERIILKRALDGASGGGNLVFTLVFENGNSRIGPITIGPAPVYPF
ncbi:MAG: DUF2125 domain-containing protein [Rhodobacteraceae bacterium]|nr:DUF2125 domain-containing protein [Paracoccaceae bacterium]